MSKIKQLSEHIISKIAAGEVIERPAYAVKELIDNAVDAKADSIAIQIEDAGLEKIVVIDNGEGMSREDIKECFKRHTTSKLSEEDTLIGIKTLGFRGEALASIASVSNMTIKSKTNQETGGTLVELRSGTLKNITPIGMPVGTTITIDNLFHSIPARKKFLKSKRTEFRQIADIVTSFALAFPSIRFSLTHNKRLLFDLPKKQEFSERLKVILGSNIVNNLISIKDEDSYIKLSGFISKPQLITQNLNKHFIFVNNRRVSDRLITLAVKEAYGNLLEQASYPVFLLFLEVPYEIVDVNIHPRKEQVAFVDNKLVFDAVSKAIKQTLSENNITFYNLSFKEEKLRGGGTTSYAGKLLKEIVIPWNVKDIAKITKYEDLIPTHNLYILVPTKQGILIVDQHAAHERILYEQFLEEFNKQKKKRKVYELPKAVNFELSVSDKEVIEENKDLLKDLGFEIKSSIDKTFKITVIPILLKDLDMISFIHEFIDSMTEENGAKSLDFQTQRMIAYLACRSAIKAGDALTKEEAARLLKKLARAKNNATCPHGRPTQIEITLSEFHRLFKRV